MVLCLRNFYSSETFDMFRELPQQLWLEVEDFSSFNLKNVKLIEYNLLANQGAEFTISDAEIKNTKAYISGSIADMQSLLVDVGENVPKEEEAAFLKVEDERVRGSCNFRKVCE